jgi:hypothetical protein
MVVISIDVVQQAEQTDLAAGQQPGQGVVRQQLHGGAGPGRQMGGQLLQGQVQAQALGIPHPAIGLDGVGKLAVGVELAGADPGIQAGDPGRIEATGSPSKATRAWLPD